jgi:hypothetical protein
MKVLGIILAVMLLGGMVVGVGYVAVSGYDFLSAQWGSLSDDWKAILIVVAALLIFCTLLASLSIQSSVKKYGLKGSGKVMAYNDFTHWYSALKEDNTDAMKAETLKAVTNQMTLWGNKPVARQAKLLYELLQENEADSDQILKKAEHVYIEIRRDLGLRGTSADSAIV